MAAQRPSMRRVAGWRAGGWRSEVSLRKAALEEPCYTDQVLWQY